MGVPHPHLDTPPWLRLGPPAWSAAGDTDPLGWGTLDWDPCELGMLGGKGT